MRALLLKSALALLGAAAAVVLLEVGLRLFDRPAPPIVEPDPLIGTRYIPGLDIAIPAEGGRGSVRFRTNRLGFVGSDPREEKPDVRIANLGDSFTAGAAVAGEENFVSRLAFLLGAALGEDVEGLNFGVGGQGIDDMERTYRAYARALEPDLVVLWSYLGNDFHDTLEGAAAENPEKAAAWEEDAAARRSFLSEALADSKVKDLVVRSGVAERLAAIARDLPGGERFLYRAALGEAPSELRLLFTEDPRNEAAATAVEEKLAALAGETRADGARLAVVAVPPHFAVDPEVRERLLAQYPELSSLGFDPDAPARALGEIAGRLGIPFLDLTPVFAGCGEGCPLYACRFCHLSAAGHAAAAEAAAAWLLRERLIP